MVTFLHFYGQTISNQREREAGDGQGRWLSAESGFVFSGSVATSCDQKREGTGAWRPLREQADALISYHARWKRTRGLKRRHQLHIGPLSRFSFSKNSSVTVPTRCLKEFSLITSRQKA